MGDCCNEGTRLIYACSGAADVGEVSDRVARKLNQAGYGKMTCLAAIGANISGFVESAKTAENLVIDGCPVACGMKNMGRIGVACKTFVLSDMGLVKGKTVITDTVVDEIVRKIKQGTGNEPKGDSGKCTGNCNCG